MTVYLYPDGRMVVSTTREMTGSEVTLMRQMIESIRDAWNAGDKSIVLGPDIQVVMVNVDIEQRLAKLEQLMGVAA